MAQNKRKPKKERPTQLVLREEAKNKARLDRLLAEDSSKVRICNRCRRTMKVATLYKHRIICDPCKQVMVAREGVLKKENQEYLRLYRQSLGLS